MPEKKDRSDPSRNVWECPVCGYINVWDSNNIDRVKALCKTDKVAVCHGSSFDNVCGHCGADLVAKDSPILAECYTHQDPDAAEEAL